MSKDNTFILRIKNPISNKFETFYEKSNLTIREAGLLQEMAREMNKLFDVEIETEIEW